MTQRDVDAVSKAMKRGRTISGCTCLALTLGLLVVSCTGSPALEDDSGARQGMGADSGISASGGRESDEATGGLGSGGTADDGTPPSGGAPGAFSTSVTLEEGQVGLCRIDGEIESTHVGFAGSGYINTDNVMGASIERAVTAAETGTYSLEIFYANEPTADRPADVLVGGEVASTGLSFPSTSSWTTYSKTSVDVTLVSGENRIVLSASENAGLANIDSLTISGAAVTAAQCEDGEAPGTGGGGNDEPRTTFRNPLNEDFGPDPWMTYHDGYYYLSATTWDKNHLSMKRGRTIQELKDASPQVIWTPGLGENAASKAMWAPEFFLLDNGSGQKRWYFYFTAGDGSADFVGQRSHVLESEGLDPMGPYTYKAQLPNYWAIDGSILEHGGKIYFMFSAWDGPTQNIYIQAMTNPWTLTGGRMRLSRPDYDWEKEGTAQVNEGPEPLYHDGRTFVTYSGSQCASPGYKLGLLELTGNDPMNAAHWWKSPTPVFQQANGNYGTGHNGFFMSPDGSEYWLVYHGVSNPNGSCWIDRTTRIQPFGWDESGLPDFGEPLALSTDIYAPSGE